MDLLLCNDNNIIYFDSFGVEHIPKERNKFLGKKYKYRHKIQCVETCDGFYNFMLKGKSC